MKTAFYVYVLFDWCGAPRYVGKGHGNRWSVHERETSRNILKNEFIEQTWTMLGEIPKIKVQENLSEQQAFYLEVLLIASIGRLPNGPLTNMNDGGDGVTGHRHSDIMRRYFADVSTAMWLDPLMRAKMSNAMIANRWNDRPERSEEHSAAMVRHFVNLPESRTVLSEAAKRNGLGKNKSAEHEAKIAAHNKARAHTPEFKEWRRALNKRLWNDPDFRAKMIASNRRRKK